MSKTREAGALGQEFSARQQARITRRAMVAEREQRINDALMAGACVIMGALFLYLVLFFAAV